MAAAAGGLAELDCPICLDPYDLVTRTPRFLPCHHSLCHSCLKSLIDRRQTQGAIKCPLCQNIALVPTEKAFGFQVNFYLEHRLATNSERPTQRTESVDRSTVPSRPEKAKSGCFGQTANEENHLPLLRRRVSALDFSTEGPASNNVCSNFQSNISELTRQSLIAPCAKHPREELVLYCKQCKVLICIICKMTTHDRHPSDDLVDVAASARQQLRAEVSQLETRNKVVQNRIQQTQERKREYLLKVKIIREQVVTRKENIVHDIASKSKQVTDRLDAHQLERVRVLDTEIKYLTENAEKIRGSITSLSGLLNRGTDMDIITNRFTPSHSLAVTSEGEEPSDQIPVLLLHSSKTLSNKDGPDHIMNLRKYPKLLYFKQIRSNRLVSADRGVWIVTGTDIRNIGFDGESGVPINVAGIVDVASNPSGRIYFLIHQKGKWFIKLLELNSVLSEFMDLPLAVDRIACCHDNSLVLARTQDGKLTLEYFSKDRKWLRTIQVPWRNMKLDDLVEMSMHRMAVLCHKSKWSSEIMVLDCGGQVLFKFSGNNAQGCNVNNIISVPGGLLIYDMECNHVLLLSSDCEVMSCVLRKERIRGWLESIREVHGGWCVRHMALDKNGVLWLSCYHGDEHTLCAVQWQN